jgi:hypothetical protein
MQIKVSFNAQDKLNVDLTSIVSYSQISTFTTATMMRKKKKRNIDWKQEVEKLYLFK